MNDKMFWLIFICCSIGLLLTLVVLAILDQKTSSMNQECASVGGTYDAFDGSCTYPDGLREFLNDARGQWCNSRGMCGQCFELKDGCKYREKMIGGTENG